MGIDENMIDDKFMEATNAMIELANRMAAQFGEEGEHKMGVAFIFAAARYNAYLAANSVTSPGELAERKEKAVEYFGQRFRQLYSSNVDDYIEHFEQYMAKEDLPEPEQAVQ